MCNFNKQDEDAKLLIHMLLSKCAQNVGGANFLLGLIEAMKKNKPNPLTHKGTKINSEHLSITWNKTVFKDKLDILEEVIHSHKSDEGQNFNILENDNAKKSKKILNMVKTLSPITFVVTPQNPENGTGFDFKIFESIEDNCVKLNPIFVAMLFCSTEYTKKALKYVPKS
ncbi:hypothetical protein [Sulfurimonas sp.]|uniref:hypothetical protein n=1 Tax=Sulfurimonas sp. TaxID=2022749 RepID=UPI002AB2DC81|nr:hypothetical protein [Sulfurimonas sp.]